MPYGLIDLVLRDARLRSLLSMRSIFYLVLRRAKPVSKEGRRARGFLQAPCQPPPLRISLTMLPRSEEHTSELQSLMRISYAVFCLKKKKKHNNTHKHTNRTREKEKCN